MSRWADKGLITCVTTLGGHRRFLRSAVEEIQREMFQPVRIATSEEGPG